MHHSQQQQGGSFPATLSVSQAAELLDVVPTTMYKWIESGDVPAVRFGGRLRVPTARLADLLGLDLVDIGRMVNANRTG